MEAELGLLNSAAAANKVENGDKQEESRPERFDPPWNLLDEEERRRERAVISIGGGHYAPKVSSAS